ncbi:MAG TPA: Arm DNA-binding domain-containing protein [Sphingopyxis sp.]|nr:Arm DNA-binding domain-containing protein [Sphingopyxis sp.]HWW55554.1 Arm DNA-binding domain-containing protein [Sphingopyxis sp.]
MSLTDVLIRSLRPESRPCKRADAGGLYLEVRPTGAKLWRFKYRYLGKDNRIALGGLSRSAAGGGTSIAGRSQAQATRGHRPPRRT